MLGRFLEIAVHAPDVLASLNFYESLGFVQATVNEVREYPYAVITDGRLFLGLHQRHLPSPSLCFVHADLAKHHLALQQAGIAPDQEMLAVDHFNEVTFHDPNRLHVRLLEARTFSPPAIAPNFVSRCGYFEELGLPVKDFAAAREYWERFDFVALEETQQPFNRLTLTSQYFNLGLHRSRALREPVLIFSDANMRERISMLKERGFELTDDMPDNLDEHCNGVLIAPEGTRLLLMQDTD